MKGESHPFPGGILPALCMGTNLAEHRASQDIADSPAISAMIADFPPPHASAKASYSIPGAQCRPNEFLGSEGDLWFAESRLG